VSLDSDKQNVEENSTPAQKSKKKPKFNFKVVLAAIAIFGLGWLMGSGRLQVSSHQSIGSNASLPDELDLSSVNTVYQSLKNNFDGQLNEQDLLDGIKSGLAKASGDPYTEYFNSSDAKEFNDEIDGVFEGIGAQLGKDTENNIIIVSPIAGYPAEKAGLKPKDIIAEIDGESAYDLTISEAVDKIRGPKGTNVTLTVVRDGKVEEISVTREEIDIPSVKTEIRNGIGILTISRFGDDTTELARKAANEFKAANVKGVILDLRGNPGGYLESAVDVSSIWLDKDATILTERRENVVIETRRASGNAILNGLKTIVLIDEGSASASEIVAGALKDNNVAQLVGLKTFGKGSVQQPINLKDGSLLKITVARWFTPAGKNIDKEGIEPDQSVEISADDLTNDRDPQLDTALQKLQ
jgi:carboxyl-terminal processing protease